MADQETASKWERKRLISTIVCVWYHFLLGLEYTAVVISLLYYLKDFFNPNTADTMYSVILAGFLVPGLLAGMIGNIVDETGKMKEVMCVLLLIITAGNILYILHFSIWFLIVGRCLTGFALCLRSCIAGEFAKWYDDPTKVLFYYQMAFSVGFVVGPATAALFTSVDFTIGNLHITKDNFVGFFMAVLSFVTFLASLFCVHNLSNSKLVKENVEQQGSSTSASSMKGVFRDCDIVLVLAANSVIFLVLSIFDLVVPMVGRNQLKMDLGQLSTSMFIAFALFALFMIALWQRLFSDGNAFRGLIFCLFCECYACIVLPFPSYQEIENSVLKVLIIIVVSFFNGLSGMSVEIAAREMLFQLVPRHSACYIDGVRSGVAISFFPLIGFLLSSFVFETIWYSAPLMALPLLIVAGLVLQRKDVIHSRIGEQKKTTTN